MTASSEIQKILVLPKFINQFSEQDAYNVLNEALQISEQDNGGPMTAAKIKRLWDNPHSQLRQLFASYVISIFIEYYQQSLFNINNLFKYDYLNRVVSYPSLPKPAHASAQLIKDNKELVDYNLSLINTLKTAHKELEIIFKRYTELSVVIQDKQTLINQVLADHQIDSIELNDENQSGLGEVYENYCQSYNQDKAQNDRASQLILKPQFYAVLAPKENYSSAERNSLIQTFDQITFGENSLSLYDMLFDMAEILTQRREAVLRANEIFNHKIKTSFQNCYANYNNLASNNSVYKSHFNDINQFLDTMNISTINNKNSSPKLNAFLNNNR